MAEEPKPRRKHKTEPPPLSLREIRFCQKYAETGNGYQSYLDAGFPEKASRNSTDQAVGKLIRKAQIRLYIRELQAASADAARLATETIAQGIYRDAFADRRKLFDDNGNLKPPHEWPDDVAATVQSIEIEELPRKRGEEGPPRKKYKVKTTDRLAARKLAGQWRGMFKTGEDGNTQDKPLVIGGDANPEGL